MHMDMYIDEEKMKEKKRLQVAGSILIWGLLIIVAAFLASRSLVIG